MLQIPLASSSSKVNDIYGESFQSHSQGGCSSPWCTNKLPVLSFEDLVCCRLCIPLLCIRGIQFTKKKKKRYCNKVWNGYYVYFVLRSCGISGLLSTYRRYSQVFSALNLSLVCSQTAQIYLIYVFVQVSVPACSLDGCLLMIFSG